MGEDAAPILPEGALSERDAMRSLSGSGISMVLTDPHRPDNPIVYVNRAFSRVTGYSAEAAVGRNCRFLQGEKSDPADVARLREAIENHTDATVDILNYRADGSPFLNRLLLTPIRDSDGELRYFLGIQKLLSRVKDLLTNAEADARRRQAAGEEPSAPSLGWSLAGLARPAWLG